MNITEGIDGGGAAPARRILTAGRVAPRAQACGELLGARAYGHEVTCPLAWPCPVHGDKPNTNQGATP